MSPALVCGSVIAASSWILFDTEVARICDPHVSPRSEEYPELDADTIGQPGHFVKSNGMAANQIGVSILSHICYKNRVESSGANRLLYMVCSHRLVTSPVVIVACRSCLHSWFVSNRFDSIWRKNGRPTSPSHADRNAPRHGSPGRLRRCPCRRSSNRRADCQAHTDAAPNRQAEADRQADRRARADCRAGADCR